MTKRFSAEAMAQISEVVRRVLREPGNGGIGVSSSQPGHVGLLGFWAKTGAGGISARSGTTLGNGTVTLHTAVGGTDAEYADANSAAVTKTCYNGSTTAVAANAYVFVCQEQLSGKFFAVWEDC